MLAEQDGFRSGSYNVIEIVMATSVEEAGDVDLRSSHFLIHVLLFFAFIILYLYSTKFSSFVITPITQYLNHSQENMTNKIFLNEYT